MTRHITRKRFILAAATLVGLLGVWLLFLRPPAKPELVTAQARTGDIEEVVLANGVLEPLELVRVGAQASGRVEHLAVKIGDIVEAGQLVAEIASQTRRNTLRDREAALANIRAVHAVRSAGLVKAEKDFERERDLLAGGSTPRAQYDAAVAMRDTARAEVQSLDAQVAQAQVALESAGIELDYTRITAPIAGTVVAIVTDEGQTVNALQTAPTIVMIARLDTMTVRADISEADVVRVRRGLPVWFSILGDPKRRFDGELRQVEPAPASIANESNAAASRIGSTNGAVYYTGLIDVANADGVLRPSMTAQVSIVLSRVSGTVLVPLSAVEGAPRAGDTARVRILDAIGEVQIRQVQVGIDNGADIQILNGLQAGETIVLGASTDERTDGQAQLAAAKR
ncbi:efflux RND transporter periplasmic adaptor subunit (plasmid) [Agrobacterium radiobacter]|uniref:Efflux protein, putative HlyD family secretion protein n=1 Tax=Agrobacterium tumefaciens str. B6 TaxID=1183423 RepID=A0A822VAW6_AGRTU|nr:efflux RND transporter periplasmic adaptor subunit [Agrobacterium tumefaciens]MQB28808.1 efflux RND transporter periplasmic adaptor subunit [Agrobacterium tumefaciens]NTA03338.1 efflux RND transporter periplasmic adaptor subunit [Agrobacterium tumefaciens]NTA94811.1 efflux RND transporter periplasmic adaptor subunit [Agrobacterium tumefaciens]NTB11601.1 efflux RND transporter periplasmic adaptor subunit [Agrobacterium tumefaciens]OCJ32606.1 efflux transporter periplasmic adaptor subunit [Ag